MTRQELPMPSYGFALHELPMSSYAFVLVPSAFKQFETYQSGGECGQRVQDHAP